jgi:hypothetical protein
MACCSRQQRSAACTIILPHIDLTHNHSTRLLVSAVLSVIYPPCIWNAFPVCPCLLYPLFTGRLAAETASAAAKSQQAAALLAGSAQGSSDSSVEWPVLPAA